RESPCAISAGASHAWLLGHPPAVTRHVRLCRGVPAEAASRGAPGGRESPSRILVLGEPYHARGDRRLVQRVNKQRVVLVPQILAEDGQIGGQDGQIRGQRLQNGQPPPFFDRGKGQHIRGMVQRRHLFIR